MNEIKIVKVPFRINLLLTVAMGAVSICAFLFTEIDKTKGPPNISTFSFLDAHPKIEMILGFAAMICGFLSIVWLAKTAWNYLLVELFSIPQMSLSSSYAAVVTVTAICAWWL